MRANVQVNQLLLEGPLEEMINLAASKTGNACRGSVHTNEVKNQCRKYYQIFFYGIPKNTTYNYISQVYMF